MAERELVAAKAKVSRSEADLKATLNELKTRLKPVNLATDAWTKVKGTGLRASDQGRDAVARHPGAAGGAVLAVMLFVLRNPIANLLVRVFGKEAYPDRVKAELLDAKENFDLTAPVVAAAKGN